MPQAPVRTHPPRHPCPARLTNRTGIPAFYTPTGAGTVLQDGGFPIRYGGSGDVEIGSDPMESRRFVNPRRAVEQEYVLQRVGRRRSATTHGRD